MNCGIRTREPGLLGHRINNFTSEDSMEMWTVNMVWENNNFAKLLSNRRSSDHIDDLFTVSSYLKRYSISFNIRAFDIHDLEGPELQA